MRCKEKAEYADGRATELSGREADDVYSPIEQLRALGAEIVFVADVGIVKYPSGKAFSELHDQEGDQETHDHKVAGMEKAIILGCNPMDLPGFKGVNDDRVPFDQVPHSPPPVERRGQTPEDELRSAVSAPNTEGCAAVEVAIAHSARRSGTMISMTGEHSGSPGVQP